MLIPVPQSRVQRPMAPNTPLAVRHLAQAASHLYQVPEKNILFVPLMLGASQNTRLRVMIPYPMTDLRESIVWEANLPLRIGPSGYCELKVGLQTAYYKPLLHEAWLNLAPTGLRLHLTPPDSPPI